MKYLGIISLTLGLAGVMSVQAEGDEPMSTVNLNSASEILLHGEITDVPAQVSIDDEVRFKVVGLLENSCRRPGHTFIYFDEPTHSFIVEQMIQTAGEVCLQRIMPFSVDVNLGRLQAGNYHVQLNRSPQRGQGFTVKSSTTELR